MEHTPTDTMEDRFRKIFVREDGLLGIGKYDEEVVLDFINAEITHFLQKREEELEDKIAHHFNTYGGIIRFTKGGLLALLKQH